MTSRVRPRRKHEQGIALVVSILVLLLVTAISITSIEQSGQESTASGRARSSSRSLYAADAGIQLALSRVSQANLAPFQLNIDGRTVQSRSRLDAVPQPIAPAGSGPTPDGYGLNMGSGYGSQLFLVNVTATFADGGTTELEAKLGRLAAGTGGY